MTRKKQGRGYKWLLKEELLLTETYHIMSLEELAKTFKRTERAIKKKAYVMELGLKKLPINPYNRPWTTEEDGYLSANYEFNNINAIAARVGRTRKGVTERAKILKIKRDKETTRLECKKHTINEAYFNSLGSNSSYVLGLICADGNLSGSGNTINIALHRDDKYLLMDIAKDMGSSHPVYDSKLSLMSTLAFCSMPMHAALMNIGLTPNKSKTLQCPDIPLHIIPDFIRGVLDGDGSVSAKAKRCKIVSASVDFINGLSEMLNDLDVSHKVYNEPYMYNGVKTNFYCLSVIRRKDVKRLYHLMYDNADLHMTRKKASFVAMGVENYDFAVKCKCVWKAITATSTDGLSTMQFESIKAAKQKGFPRVNSALKSPKPYKGYTWKYAKGVKDGI